MFRTKTTLSLNLRRKENLKRRRRSKNEEMKIPSSFVAFFVKAKISNASPFPHDQDPVTYPHTRRLLHSLFVVVVFVVVVSACTPINSPNTPNTHDDSSSSARTHGKSIPSLTAILSGPCQSTTSVPQAPPRLRPVNGLSARRTARRLDGTAIKTRRFFASTAHRHTRVTGACRSRISGSRLQTLSRFLARLQV